MFRRAAAAPLVACIAACVVGTATVSAAAPARPAAGLAAAGTTPKPPVRLPVHVGATPGPDGRPARGIDLPRGAAPLPAKIPFRGWMVADADTGAVLGAQEATVRHLPASTLKVLTALTVLPHLSPKRLVTIPAAAEAVDGTKVGYTVGVRYTVRELATGMLIASGNDAARTLALAYGSIPKTIAAMKRVAADLGARDTVPGDPAGLDAPGEVTTPYDLALIARAALRSPAVAPYFLIRKATVRAPHGKSFQIQTHNDLLGTYPGTIGVKNGYTIKAQTTYVGAAHRYGHTLIVTLMSGNAAYAPTARALLNWGFATVARNVQPVGRLVSPGDAAERPTAAPSPTPAPTAPTPARTTASARPAAAPASSAGTTSRWDRLSTADKVGGAAFLVLLVAVLIGVVSRRRRS